MEKANMERLVAQAMRGEDGAFAQLCEVKARDVLYICIKVMGNWADGEDAAQEVFIRMQKSFGQLQNPVVFQAWMNRIVLSVCTDMRRKMKRGTNNAPIEDMDDFLVEDRVEFLPAELAEDESSRRELLQIVDNLPDKLRRVVLLYYYEEMSQAEIGAAMGCSRTAVDHLLRRARKSIRASLEEKGSAYSFSSSAGTVAAGSTVLGCAMRNEALETIPESMISNTLAAISAAPIAGPVAVVGTAAAVTSTAVAAQALRPQVLAQAGVGIAAAVTAGAMLLTAAVGDQALPNFVPDSSSAVVQGVEVPQLPQHGAAAGEEMEILQVFTLNGQVNFADKDGNVVPAGVKYAQGFDVALLDANGTRVANTSVQQDGSFTLHTGLLPQGAGYTIYVTPPRGTRVHFTADNPGGILALTGGLEAAQQDGVQLYITDLLPPTGAIYIQGQNATMARIDPQEIRLVVGDETDTTVTWAIYRANGKTALYTGEGNVVDEALQTLWRNGAKGEYVLVYTITDLAGNTSEVEQDFRIAAWAKTG